MIDGERNPTGQTFKGTVEDEIILALIDQALKGDVAAIREVLDTRYGKATERQSVELSVNLENDDEARLERARVVLIKLQSEVDDTVERVKSQDPSLNREEFRKQLLASLPQWCAEDWGVDVKLLCAPAVDTQSP